MWGVGTLGWVGWLVIKRKHLPAIYCLRAFDLWNFGDIPTPIQLLGCDVHSGWKSYRRHDKDIRKGDSTRPLDLLRLRRSRLRNPLNRGAPRDEFSGKPSRLYIPRKKKNSHQNCLSPYVLEIPNFPHQKQKKPPKRWAYIRESFFCINYLFQPPTKIPWFLLVDRSHILPRSQGTLVNLDQFRVVSRVPWRLYRWRLGGFWFKRLYGGGFRLRNRKGEVLKFRFIWTIYFFKYLQDIHIYDICIYIFIQSNQGFNMYIRWIFLIPSFFKS